MFTLSETMSGTCFSPVPLSFPLEPQPVLDSFDSLLFRRQLMRKGTATLRLVTCIAWVTLRKYCHKI